MSASRATSQKESDKRSSSKGGQGPGKKGKPPPPSRPNPRKKSPESPSRNENHLSNARRRKKSKEDKSFTKERSHSMPRVRRRMDPEEAEPPQAPRRANVIYCPPNRVNKRSERH